MKKLKWVVIGIAVLLIFTYGMYSMLYAGNYNVKVEVPVSGFDYNAGYNSVTASGITTTSDSTSFWDAISGLAWYKPSGPSVNPANPYVLYVELGATTQSQTIDSSAQTVPFDFSQTLTFTFKNVGAGEATIHIYIMDQTLSTKLYDHNWPVVIG